MGLSPVELRRSFGSLGSAGRPVLRILDRADKAMLVFENRAIASQLEDKIRQFDECFAEPISPKTADAWVQWYKRLRVDTETFLERSVSREDWFRFRTAKPTNQSPTVMPSMNQKRA